ncbi:hypothetical protein GCM10019059_42820 [Camelimonas fluminis]|uniref:Uncharacterized protein n=1 Tax=Camelimonas fluminis TaxID=1576911 RepID=A0ABV7UC12_9HYPH|nr:hypothetical protein [Camelimonas fluminis]GHE79144.1 hypothetical protein GCM10019059_42180 [Camelimonas fluminis]GHE79783.1 hypothetical protein GCM10019059_42820 [Camelimonas fluminis]
MMDEWIFHIRQVFATYWNIPTILAYRHVYIGIAIGAAILVRMAPGALKIGAIALAFYGPYLYFTYFHHI